EAVAGSHAAVRSFLTPWRGVIALHGRRRRVLLLDIGHTARVPRGGPGLLGDGGAGPTDDGVRVGGAYPGAHPGPGHLVGAETGEVAASLFHYLRGAITKPRSQGSFDTLDGTRCGAHKDSRCCYSSRRT